MFTPRVLNRSATPCLGLEVFEVSNLRRCRTHGSTVFAPVVRGEDPDREAALRTASERPEDRGGNRSGQVHGVTRAEARPVVRVQRERVVPPLPAETAEDRAVDLGSVLFGAGRAEEGGPAPARIPQAAPHGLGPVARLGAGRAAQGVEPGTDRGTVEGPVRRRPVDACGSATSAFTSGSTPSRSGRWTCASIWRAAGNAGRGKRAGRRKGRASRCACPSRTGPRRSDPGRGSAISSRTRWSAPRRRGAA